MSSTGVRAPWSHQRLRLLSFLSIILAHGYHPQIHLTIQKWLLAPANRVTFQAEEEGKVEETKRGEDTSL